MSLRVLAVTNLYPTPDDPAYGAFVATQVQSLSRAGIDVDVEFVNGRHRTMDYLAAPLRIRRLVRAGGFDVVHAHYGLTGFLAAFQRLPLVVTFYGDDLLGTPDRRGRVTLKSRLIRRLGVAAARRAAGLICMSEEMRQALPSAADRARAHVIPNGVDTDRFCPGDKAAARARLGLDPGERLVLFPNTPGEARKRLDLAEAGVAALAAGGVAARLWVVTRVPHNQMPDHFHAADCLLLTSDWEGSPNVVKEALCCDTPVVSVEVGDVRHWLDLTPGCRLVERTPAAIAAGLREVLCGPGRVDGSAVRDHLSADRVAARVVDVYRAVLARRRS
jgi:glycosyltransferase involved in cell wall biosynthesis